MMRKLAHASIRLYQMAVSPYIRGYCRHTPSCSSYALEAVDKFGAFRGIGLAARRLGRCRPMSTSGYDPVP